MVDTYTALKRRLDGLSGSFHNQVDRYLPKASTLGRLMALTNPKTPRVILEGVEKSVENAEKTLLVIPRLRMVTYDPADLRAYLLEKARTADDGGTFVAIETLTRDLEMTPEEGRAAFCAGVEKGLEGRFESP